MMKDAFDKAKKENGREAVKLREQASQKFSLLTTVGGSVKYKPSAVNLVQTGGTMVSKQMVSSKVSTEQRHSTGKVSAMVTAMVSPKNAMSGIPSDQNNCSQMVSGMVSVENMVSAAMVSSKVSTETPEFART